ncbi:hypothetical protein B0A48_01301 [Cryoendolithus antarcticus]|uniref:Mid2 domain-containing protein n=1 Tax=Cryoendolithus antarcticus TaxID=1507870 RepID=A0A1V8TSX0_9PEZI|nr:hypothetical protein B0A48_01301 [Cryoendolithus antarcticus]
MADGKQVTTWFVDYCTEFGQSDSSSSCINTCASEATSNMTPCDGTQNSTRWCCGIGTDCCETGVGVVVLQQALGSSAASAATSVASSASSSTSSSATSSVSSTTNLIATSSSSLGFTSSTSFSASSSGSNTLASQASSDSSLLTSQSSVSTSSMTSQTTAAVSPTTSSANATTSKMLSGGAIAGIVIGVVAGLALAAGGVLLARSARRKRHVESMAPSYDGPSAPVEAPAYSPRPAMQELGALGKQDYVPEMPGAPPSELYGSTASIAHK